MLNFYARWWKKRVSKAKCRNRCIERFSCQFSIYNDTVTITKRLRTEKEQEKSHQMQKIFWWFAERKKSGV